MADYTIDIAVPNDLTKAVYVNDTIEHAIAQIVTDGSYDGSTATATLQETVDGVNWHTIQDSSGNPVTIILAAAATSYLLKTSIYYGTKMRILFTAGDATIGDISVTSNLKE